MWGSDINFSDERKVCDFVGLAGAKARLYGVKLILRSFGGAARRDLRSEEGEE